MSTPTLAPSGRAPRPAPGNPAPIVAVPPAAPDPAETPLREREAARRLALGRFLRARRERLAPALAGLPNARTVPGRRRRTPGLRREEVAERAGVSAAWYTWLEQGRDVRASAATLEHLAGALQLSAADRAYLRTLAHGGHDEPAAERTAPAVPPTLQRVLDALTPLPAYVVDARWDVLAWNEATRRVLGDFAARSAAERNQLRFVLLDPAMRALLPNWEEEAQSAVALFRASTAGYVGEPWHRALVDALTRESPTFARWWPALELRATHRARKELEHPRAGRLVLAPTTLHVAEDPDLRVVVYAPVDGSEGEDTRARLARLLSDEYP